MRLLGQNGAMARLSGVPVQRLIERHQPGVRQLGKGEQITVADPLGSRFGREWIETLPQGLIEAAGLGRELDSRI